MKGSYSLGDKRFRLDEISIPETREHNVPIRVAACDIRSMDIHIYCGSKDPAEVHPPVILGYELARVVEKTDNAITMIKSGDRVTVDPDNYCGKCHYCKTGKKQVCKGLYAVGTNRDGGFAQYRIIPETQCYQLDKKIPLKYGTMTEPLACCIRGIGRISLVPGSTVCIIEGGVIGLIMVQLAKLSGTSKVVLSESMSIRRGIGTKMGMDAAIDPVYEEVRQRLTKVLGTSGADVVIGCAGIPVAAGQAFEVADKGVVILPSNVPSPGSTYIMHPEEIFQRELTTVGPIINSDTHGCAVVLINSNVIQLEPLITHLFPLDQLEQAILAQQSSKSIKAIVEP